MGYWDLPTTVLVPMIAERMVLPGAPLDAVACCEHKYWARLAQREVVPELTPRFQAVDAFAEDPLATLKLDYPFWLKPVKAHSSFLGFYIDGPETLTDRLALIRDRIDLIAKPFNEFLAHVDPPMAATTVDGYHYIAEEIISTGSQCTLEGYCWEKAPHIFGVVDSLRAGRFNSFFTRYQYPSKLPREIQARMACLSVRLMRHIGNDNGAFNIEFFWNPETGRISLLEINTRISRSHSPLFQLVDGSANLKAVMDLALGRAPEFPRGRGAFALSGKFMLRFFEDGILERVPDEADLRQLHETFPEARARILAPPRVHTCGPLRFRTATATKWPSCFWLRTAKPSCWRSTAPPAKSSISAYSRCRPPTRVCPTRV